MFLLAGCSLGEPFGPSGHNRAQDELTPLLADYGALHPHQVCAAGYGDNGIDAMDSAYTVQEIVDRPADLPSLVESISARETYPLATDDMFISGLKAGGYTYAGETYDPTAVYLASPQPWTPFKAPHQYGEQLQVVIYTVPKVLLSCESSNARDWHQVSIPPGKAALSLTMTTAD